MAEMLEIKLDRVDQTYRPGEELTEVLHITPTSLLKVLFIVVIVTFKIKGGHVVAKY